MFVYNISPGDHITKKLLQEHFDACANNDDVFNLSFLDYVVFFGSSKDRVSMDNDAIEYLKSGKFGGWTFIYSDESKSVLASGPYVVGRSMTWQPWRLYTDTHETMMTSFRPAYTSSSECVGYS